MKGMKHWDWRANWATRRWCRPIPTGWLLGNTTESSIAAETKSNGSFDALKAIAGSFAVSTNSTCYFLASSSWRSLLKLYELVLTGPSQAGHRHHCHSCRDAAACIVQGQTESPSNDVLEQYQAICLGLVYWYTYATDNSDTLVNNYDAVDIQNEINNQTYPLGSTTIWDGA